MEGKTPRNLRESKHRQAEKTEQSISRSFQYWYREHSIWYSSPATIDGPGKNLVISTEISEGHTLKLTSHPGIRANQTDYSENPKINLLQVSEALIVIQLSAKTKLSNL